MYNKIKYGTVVLGLLLPLATQAQHCRNSYAGDSSIAACDITFLSPPVFGDLCINSSALGIYTIRNNTPVALKILDIRIQPNDGFPSSASSIIPAPTNNCAKGSTLAAGGTCNIQVQLTSTTTLGAFNRVLQVWTDTRQVEIDAPAITASVLNCTAPPPVPPFGFTPTVPVSPLLPLFSTAILGASTITNSGASTLINGDLDLSPGSAVVGITSGMVVNGVQNITNPIAAAMQIQALQYFNDLFAQACDYTTPVGDVDLSTLDVGSGPGILPPGVYCFHSSAQIPVGANLTLNGAAGSSYTFKMGIDGPSTLITGIGSTVTLSNGTPVRQDNINWAVGSSATLNGTNFYGIVDAKASISFGTGAQLSGRAWALTGAVTLLGNHINTP